jgi:hypothetical protein
VDRAWVPDWKANGPDGAGGPCGRPSLGTTQLRQSNKVMPTKQIYADDHRGRRWSGVVQPISSTDVARRSVRTVSSYLVPSEGVAVNDSSPTTL